MNKLEHKLCGIAMDAATLTELVSQRARYISPMTTELQVFEIEYLTDVAEEIQTKLKRLKKEVLAKNTEQKHSL